MKEIEEIQKQIRPLSEEIHKTHREDYNHKISRTVAANKLQKLEEKKKELIKKLCVLLNKEQIRREQEQQVKEDKIIADAKEYNRQRREMQKLKAEQQSKEKPKKISKKKTAPKKKKPTTRRQPSKGVKLTKYKQPKKTSKKKPRTKTNQKKQQTYKSLIIKALKHDKVNSEEKLLYIVDKWQPGKDKETLRRQVRNIISIIKKSKEYKFNDKQYKIIKRK